MPRISYFFGIVITMYYNDPSPPHFHATSGDDQVTVAIMTRRPVRTNLAEPTTGTRVRLTFTNGEQREIDLLPYRRGPIFETIRSDPAKFREIAVDRELGTVVWPNGADIDPDVLYKGLRPAWSGVEAQA